MTPCNGSLCSAMTAEGSMPGWDDSKGWHRSPRQGGSGISSTGRGRDKHVSERLWHADLTLVWGGHCISSWGPFQPSFPSAQSETRQPWAVRANGILSSVPVDAELQFEKSPHFSAPSTPASSWCASLQSQPGTLGCTP